MNHKKQDYIDGDGIRRRVLVPPDGVLSPEEGIPASLDLVELYPQMPIEFVASLSNALWDVGIIEPSDFLKPESLQKIQAALLSIVRKDALSIITYAKERNRK